MPDKVPLSIMDDIPKWQRTAPYVRRFIVITGWLSFISIPILCLTLNRNVSAVFASMYATFSAVLGVAVGFYFYKRGNQDVTIIEATKEEAVKAQEFERNIETAIAKALTAKDILTQKFEQEKEIIKTKGTIAKDVLTQKMKHEKEMEITEENCEDVLEKKVE